MFGTAVDVLTTPREFFERRPEPSLRAPAAVVLLAGFVNVLVVVPVVYEFRYVLPGEAVWLAAGGSVLAFVVVVGAKWFVLTGVLYGTTVPLGGEGDARRLLAYVGWSHLPNVLGGVVVLAATLVVLASLDAPTSADAVPGFAREFGRGPLLDVVAAYGAVQTRAGASLEQVQFVVAVGQLLWDAYIWVAALVVGRGLDRRAAAVAVALPVLAALLL